MSRWSERSFFILAFSSASSVSESFALAFLADCEVDKGGGFADYMCQTQCQNTSNYVYGEEVMTRGIP